MRDTEAGAVEVATECCDRLLDGGYFKNTTSVAHCKAFVSACAAVSTEDLFGVQDLHCPNPASWRATRTDGS